MNTAASAMRGALKEPAKTKAAAQEAFSYSSSVWTAGEQSAKTPVTSLKMAGK